MASTALQERMNTVRTLLDKMKGEIANALPAHLTPDRMIRVFLTAVQTTPKLLDCDPRSLLQALMTASQLGLEPDGVLGQAYLIPYGDKVQFIPGYKGLLTLAYNSGEIASLSAHEVYSNDFFEFEYGMEEKLRHKPTMEADRGRLIGFYAVARLKNGMIAFEVMNVAQVEAIRDKSQGYQAYLRYKKRNPNTTSPWVDHFDQMGRKTLIRRLANYLPRSVQKAAALEAAYEAGRPAIINDLGEVLELTAATDEDIAETEQAAQAETVKATRASRQKQTLAAATETVDRETGEITEAAAPKAIEAPREEPMKVDAKPAPEPVREQAATARAADPLPQEMDDDDAPRFLRETAPADDDDAFDFGDAADE